MNRNVKTLALAAVICTAIAFIGYAAMGRIAGSKLWALDAVLIASVAAMAIAGLVSAFVNPPTVPLLIAFAAACPATGACWAACRATNNGWLLIAGCGILLVATLILLLRCQDLEETVSMPTLLAVGMLEIMPTVFFM